MEVKERVRKRDNKMQCQILDWILEKNKGTSVKTSNIEMRFVF